MLVRPISGMRHSIARFVPVGFRNFSDEVLRKTPLFDIHKEMGAETTGFGGWDMPLYYKSEGIMKEHTHCREKAGLFDVSHMVPVKIFGSDRVKFAERIVPADVTALPEGTGCLSSLPNENGGLIDDLIITKNSDHLYMVINAGHEDKDLPHMHKYTEGLDVSIEPVEDRGLMALQGPSAVKVLGTLCEADFSTWAFMTGRSLKVGGVDCFVTRSGYTGEDGFEIMCEGKEAPGLFSKLLANEDVKPIGLGARDSLRLEAGLCLYGNDMDDTTTPVEAVLLWTIPKHRRVEGSFVGVEKILEQIKDKSKVTRKRVGFTNTGPPARSHDKVFNLEGRQVGEITSGVYGPTVKKPVSMGYVEPAYAKKTTELQVEIRGKLRPLVVTPMPFTPANFFRG